MRHRLLLLALAAMLIVPAAAQAADSHAPHGARLDWLPSDEWVMSSWLPYDEARLYALIHSDRVEVDAWLDDHRTLGQLARKRGWSSQRTLARALVAPRLKGVRPAMRPVLERRALETLTQGHLSNHVIFHVFHTPAIAEHAPTTFGLRPATFRRLRDSGLSPATIAQRGGRTRAGAQTRIAHLLEARGQRAVSLGAMSRTQARALYAEQTASLAAFMSHTYRTPSQQVSFLCRPH
jgi:signal transduction histidine kinase